jgi:hypothetical protein
MTTSGGCAVLATVMSAIAPAVVFAQQATAQTRPSSSAQAVRVDKQTPAAQTPRPTPATPQGFSVALVLGDLQGASVTDDVPVAARKALVDMKDFLPFKSYRLLDAAWLLCCGHDGRRSSFDQRRAVSQNATDSVSQILRGPEDQEYELKLYTSRAENSRVFVRFVLETASDPDTPAGAMAQAQLTRQLGELQDRRAMLEVQLQEIKKKVEVGITPPAEVTKLEIELRGVQRRIDDLKGLVDKGSARAARSNTFHSSKKIIDTSFTMDVGETVVVGTSRLRGGTKALIALLTAVPPRR